MSITLSAEQEARISWEMAQYEKECKWVIKNYDRLREDYPNQYIAVLDSKIVDSSPQEKIGDLGDRLRNNFPQDYSRIFVEFIYKDHPNFIL